MRFERTDRKTGETEIIDQNEILFRLSSRTNRPLDIANLMAGKIVHADYSDYKKLSDF